MTSGTSNTGRDTRVASSAQNILGKIKPRRKIDGIAAVLLPFDENGEIDWRDYEQLLETTSSSGLRPAVNMDTGYVHLLTPSQRQEVLEAAAAVLGGEPFVAGAYVEGRDGDLVSSYLREVELIQAVGGTPIMFQCSRLKQLSRDRLIDLYRQVANACSELLAFELGEMFAPFGKIFELDVIEVLMQIENLKGLKHSSLQRGLEWERLELRDRVRPDFRIYTGNDLAIDMVMYGSDYLLGLASFAPELFALRDRYWAVGSPNFFELNDVLQFLGAFAFRHPVPAYRHSAAQFLRLRGVIKSDQPHPESPRRPNSDRQILAEIWSRTSRFRG